MVKGMIPLTRVDCKRGRKLARAINSSIIVIPIYDLISDKTGNPNQLFKKIKSAGGIHNFLDYQGIIILSTIMRDDLIKLLKYPEDYAEIINSLKPNFYFTPDGFTYEKKEKDSLQEINRILNLTQKLIKLCPDSKPIGLVKGCNDWQIKFHKSFLKRLGINIFVFHTSDFFRDGGRAMINKARHYCSLIKEDENILLLYGLGSPRLMSEFSFADLFITYTHFITAKWGKVFDGIKRRKFSNMDVYEASLYNFKQILIHLSKLKYQTKLFTGGKFTWAEEQQELLFAIQNQKVKE